MALRRALLTALAVLLAALGTVSLTKPHVFLRVPKIGFLLYAILGGGPIPPYIDTLLWQNEHLWAEPGDVIVAVPAKSGTTWTFQTVHQIRNRGVENYTNLLQEVPWLELVYYPGQSLEHRALIMLRSKKHYNFKVFKSHQAPPQIKIRPDAKYVVVTRNLMDAIASFRPFLSQHNPQFVKMWGGFPDPNQTDQEYADWILKDIGNGKETGLDSFFLDPIAGWWPYRKLPNVLFLHYSDRLKESQTTRDAERIAKFLGVNLTKEELENVRLHSSFKWMKEHEGIYSYQMRTLGWEMGPFQGDPNLPFSVINEGAMVVKGEGREAATVMPPEFYAKAKERAIKRLGPKVYKWVEEGGVLPDVELGE